MTDLKIILLCTSGAVPTSNRNLISNAIIRDNELFIFDTGEAIQQSMMKNKVKVDGVWKYQPSAEDELVHLCCHAIFDKRLVKESYAKRIDELFGNCDEEKLKWLLERAFYKVSNNIFEDIKNNRTSEIYNSYISFIDY